MNNENNGIVFDDNTTQQPNIIQPVTNINQQPNDTVSNNTIQQQNVSQNIDSNIVQQPNINQNIQPEAEPNNMNVDYNSLYNVNTEQKVEEPKDNIPPQTKPEEEMIKTPLENKEVSNNNETQKKENGNLVFIIILFIILIAVIIFVFPLLFKNVF